MDEVCKERNESAERSKHAIFPLASSGRHRSRACKKRAFSACESNFQTNFTYRREGKSFVASSDLFTCHSKAFHPPPMRFFWRSRIRFAFYVLRRDATLSEKRLRYSPTNGGTRSPHHIVIYSHLIFRARDRLDSLASPESLWLQFGVSPIPPTPGSNRPCQCVPTALDPSGQATYKPHLAGRLFCMIYIGTAGCTPLFSSVGTPTSSAVLQLISREQQRAIKRSPAFHQGRPRPCLAGKPAAGRGGVGAAAPRPRSDHGALLSASGTR
ncbi:hypothetical protein DFH11DRAFT_1640097 [Phellopilus nigrolimitatus]|nr:hypothetical protein DFH11DRAFT_1640097 [Phellopilus nigrolimitatus]